MRFSYVVLIVGGLILSACTPASSTVQQNVPAQQTPTPAKQKMIQFNNSGW